MQSNSPEQFHTIAQVTQYNVRRRIGNGGLLVVRSRRSGNKYIEKRFDSTESSTERAKAEIQILMKIRDLGRHRHMEYINKIIDSFVDSNGLRASIWLEYCESGSLAGLIRRHAEQHLPIFERYCWKAFQQIAIAVNYCHYGDDKSSGDWRSIIIRDLKPDNVLITMGDGHSTPEVRLTDFGYARYENTAQQLTEEFEYGHRDFVPPEHPTFNKASDVWQIATIIACLLTLNSDPRNAAALASDYSQELVAIIAGCRRQACRDRISSEVLPDMLLGGMRHRGRDAAAIVGRLILHQGTLEVRVT